MDDNKILIVDDDVGVCELLLDICEQCHLTGKMALNAEQFKKAYLDFNPSIIVLDLHLGHEDGVELLRHLSDLKSNAKIVLISGYDEKILSVAHRLGRAHGLNMVASVQKPVKLDRFVSLLDGIKRDIEIPSIEQLDNAIDNHEIILYYQPKINLLNQKIVGVEALARWDRGHNQFVMPDVFIAKAEENNLIKKVTDSIVGLAFESYPKLRQVNPDIVLSINLSGKDLDDLELPNKLVDLAKKYDVSPSNICFEVTETAVMAQPKLVMEILVRLRLKGFLLSIDDFGTGYSSLVELRKMPFNEIKVDKSFVFELNVDKEDQIITKAIIDLGHHLGLSITAEGVESLETMRMLQSFECDVAQGYYFYRPLPLQKFIEGMSDFIK